MKSIREHSAKQLRNRQAGLSLVELMISIVIGLILVSSISMLIVEQDRTRLEMDKASRQIENGRYATQLLRNDLQHAGYYGDYWNLATKPGVPAAMPNACEKDDVGAIEKALSMPVQGFDSITAMPAPLSACLADVNHLDGTDVLIIRRADTVTTPVASAVPGQIYLQTNYKEFKLATASNNAQTNDAIFNLLKFDGTKETNLRRLLVHIYYISPCNTPAAGNTACAGAGDDGGQPVPTLKRLELDVDSAGARVLKTVPLVEGIQAMQLDYGLDSDGSDGSPDGGYKTGTRTITHPTGTQSAAPFAVADWLNVMSVRLNLLSRNKEPTAGHIDAKTYQLGAGGNAGPFNDAFKRHVFSETVRVVNAGGRREK